MTTLKGRVRKTDRGYIWESQQDGCKECMELDGKVFESQDDIPDRPHPNCKCQIEAAEEAAPQASGGKEKDEEENMPERDKFVDMLRQINNIKQFLTEYNKYIRKYPSKILNPDITKKLLDTGVPIYGKLFNETLAPELWKMASEDFKKSQDFIKRNGRIYENTGDLVKNENLQRFEHRIHQKVQSQFNRADANGVYFHQNSEVAKAINNSQEFQKYIKEKENYVKNGGKVNKSSIQFHRKTSGDLYHAFGKIEILESKLSKDEKYIQTYLLDTYDFNPDENTVVQAGRDVQDAGMLTPYYTVTKVVTPI